MRLLKLVAALAVASCFQVSGLLACEQFKPLDQDAAEKLMETFSKPDATAMSRIFAFKTLSCAQEPIVRRFALEEGLKSKDRLLRAQAMAEGLMQRDSVRVELIEEASLSADSKNWIKSQGGSLIYTVKTRDRSKNCVGVYGSDQCDSYGQFVIDGTNVRLTQQSLFGEFTLQADNTLRGMIKPNSYSPPVPAKISIL